VAKTYDERVKQSHKTTEKEMKVHNKKVNFSRVNMDTVGDYHTEGVLLAADASMRQATLHARALREEKELRLKSGKGNLDDLRSKLNAMKS
jgi:hypothetical protein